MITEDLSLRAFQSFHPSYPAWGLSEIWESEMVKPTWRVETLDPRERVVVLAKDVSTLDEALAIGRASGTIFNVARSDTKGLRGRRDSLAGLDSLDWRESMKRRVALGKSRKAAEVRDAARALDDRLLEDELQRQARRESFVSPDELFDRRS